MAKIKKTIFENIENYNVAPVFCKKRINIVLFDDAV
jgi:hypothetical protein